MSGTESLDKRTYEVFATATVKFADVIERETDFVIHDWMERAQKHEDLMRIPLTFDARTGHLPQLVRDVQPDYDWMYEQRPDLHYGESSRGLCVGNAVIRRLCLSRSLGFSRYISLLLHIKAQLSWT